MFDLLPYPLRRVHLRGLRDGDVDAFHAYRSDPDVARFQGWEPMSRGEAAAFLHEQAAPAPMPRDAWRQVGIATRHDDALIGDAGVWLSADASLAEFGLTIAPPFQGRGYGSECVAGLIALLFAGTPAREIVASADVRNRACLAALQRAGMHLAEVRRAEYKGEMCTEHVFSLRRGAGVHA